jgi:hypothetical protein
MAQKLPGMTTLLAETPKGLELRAQHDYLVHETALGLRPLQ